MTSSTTAPAKTKEAVRLGPAQYLGYAGGGAVNNLTFSLTSAPGGSGLGGYVAGAATQSEEALDAIRYVTGACRPSSSPSGPRSCWRTR